MAKTMGEMKKLLGLLSLLSLLSSLGWGDNVVFNSGFNETPWDSGWTKDTLTEVGFMEGDTAWANVIINQDTGKSLPNCCYLYTYGKTHVSRWGGHAFANANSKIFQYFPEVTNCTCKVYIKYRVKASGSPDYSSDFAKGRISLFINGEWESIWEIACMFTDSFGPCEKDTNSWVDVCTTLASNKTVSGIKFEAQTFTDTYVNSSPGSHGRRDEAEFWIDDIYISKVAGIEEKKEKKKRTIQAYPNPFVDVTALSLSNLKEEEKIRIYNSAGKLVEGSHTNIIGRNLPAGIYFVKIKGYMPIKIIKIWRVQ